MNLKNNEFVVSMVVDSDDWIYAVTNFESIEFDDDDVDLTAEIEEETKN